MKRELIYIIILLLSLPEIKAEKVEMGGREYEMTTIMERVLAPGVNFQRVRLEEYPLNISILTVDMDNPYNRVETMLAHDAVYQKETLEEAVSRLSEEGRRVVAGASANFTCVENQFPHSDCLIGACYNGCMRNSVIASETNMASDTWCGGYTKTGNMLIDTEKNVYMNSWPYYGFVRSTKTGNQMIYQVNKVCRNNELAFYDQWYPADKLFMPVDTYETEDGETHFIQTDGVSTEIYLMKDDESDWISGDNMEFTVMDIRRNRETGMRGGYDAAIVVRGATRDAFNRVEAGDKLTILYGWSSLMSGEGIKPMLEQAIGGNTLAMSSGEINMTTYSQEGNMTEDSRCCYATTADGRTLGVFVVEKSENSWYGESVGCKVDEMCSIAKHYGFTEMINCDPSVAQMVVDGCRSSATADGSPIPVANGVVIYDISPGSEKTDRIEFEKYDIDVASNTEFRPVLLAYNEYNSLINKNVKGFTLTCDPALGTCEGEIFKAGKMPATGLLTAYYDGCEVSKVIKVSENGGVEAVIGENDASVSIYPNPILSGNSLNIKASSDIQRIEIYSLSGTEILSISGSGNEMAVMLPNLSQGMYLARIFTAKGLEIKKIIIN